MTNYFTSDLHLGHNNIIKLCNRPFTSLEEMDRTIIQNINNTVYERDTLYIIGDLIYKSSKDPIEYIKQIKCKKVLILGNHDTWYHKDPTLYNKYFQEVTQYLDRAIDGRRVIMFHYPILEWQGYHSNNCYHIYGHTHSDFLYNKESAQRKLVESEPRMFNATVDRNQFKPQTLEQLIYTKASSI